MRIVSSIFALLTLVTLAACAAPTAATRGSDTAVRAERRRVSDAVYPDPIRAATAPISDSHRSF
jgi:hypothetical protein